ncbi:MAG: rRNA pseudouridine synthase [Rhodospirillales bacterium]|jgi:23S rRNA pseudouridine2605 synthase|nr:rRNA pseudouridine synthase [Rhodospirillales bacterium]MBT4040021.1 rRNA pseudouridine synthase [Rhodospirillales bacterium]MBT4627880.1 rRNA pseudouridine synthase [Rhodospirillales bacterium]MBT5351420.1 rRNA pseudouridine synthase [Rhodospirillales bacterium]MBT5521991.1 rRNA pseudouridine synthase [Rhodospirillales bacterium]
MNKRANPPKDSTPEKGERIAKVMARAGLCSRREAERWIEGGRVAVDGNILESPAFTVTSANSIAVDGKVIAGRTETKLWRYHKPPGLLVSNNDPEGRPTIFERLPQYLPRVVTVGRLDMNSEGLLLLTNDGELARFMERPDTGWVRQYRVRVNSRVNEKSLEKLAKGITVSGIRYGSIKASLDRQQGANAWLNMSLTEGKNREIRKVLEHMDMPVSRLIRVTYGPFQLGKMERGQVEETGRRMLKDSVPKDFDLG